VPKGHVNIVVYKPKNMGKTDPKEEKFEAMVQSRGQGGRKVIELPKSIRKSFDVGKYVRVSVKELT